MALDQRVLTDGMPLHGLHRGQLSGFESPEKENTGPSSVGRMLSRWPYSGPRGKQENRMRRLLCNAIYWLVEPLLDRLEERKAARDEAVRRACALKENQ